MKRAVRPVGRIRALPQNLHVLPKGAKVTRLCGAHDGGFVRQRDAAWLKKFLKQGGGLCPGCRQHVRVLGLFEDVDRELQQMILAVRNEPPAPKGGA